MMWSRWSFQLPRAVAAMASPESQVPVALPSHSVGRIMPRSDLMTRQLFRQADLTPRIGKALEHGRLETSGDASNTFNGKIGFVL